MTISITQLSDYLSNMNFGPSLKLTLLESKDNGSQSLPWKGGELPWNGVSCLSVVCYVLKFCSDSEHTDVLDTIMRLNDLVQFQYDSSLSLDSVSSDTTVRKLGDDNNADTIMRLNKIIKYDSSLDSVFSDDNADLSDTSTMDRLLDLVQNYDINEHPVCYKDEIASLVYSAETQLNTDYHRIKFHSRCTSCGTAETFVNIFIPKVQHFFTVPKAKTTQHLTAFIHFLLQILNSESHGIVYEHLTLQRIHTWSESRLREKLNFILVVLGDVPFQFTYVEQVKTILIEFEIVANEAGSFIYSCFFRTSPVNAAQFLVEILALLQKFDSLNVKIVKHCEEFSKLPLPTNVSPTTVTAFDSLFIVESLLGDIQNFLTMRSTDAMKNHINTLLMELLSAQSFLKDTNVPEETEFQQLKVHIKDTAYEAEYLLNSYVVGDLLDSYFSLRLLVTINKFELIRRDFTETMISSGAKILKVEKNITLEIPSQKMLTPGAVDYDDDGAVGFKAEMLYILDKLTGGSDDLQFICIYGMPGLGKTTLARRLYNHRLVTSQFDKCAWCVVSQTYQKRKVLVEILLSMRSMSDKDRILKMEDESLISEIHKTLIYSRYLIVIDDVWDSGMWNDLGRYFRNDKNGSRILFTTRIRDAAPSNSLFHTPSFLSIDQSWKLLEKKVFLDEPCPPQLQGAGKRIAEKCNGLPLAVVVIAGTLANIPKEICAWEKVEKSLEMFTGNCREILELSYRHLPNHLKLCFLYLGVFPEDEQIPVKKLVQLWTIEGFVQKEELAEECLMDLINRSLVQAGKMRSTGGVKTCTIHDLLREMCLEICKEENFLSLIQNDEKSTDEKHQRLCVLPTGQVHLRPFSLHCRSLFGNLTDPSSYLPQMKRIKVMEITLRVGMTHIKLFQRFNLLCLRYLVINRVIPEECLYNLVNLEVLHCENSVDVSPIILKLEKLRHMHVPTAQFVTGCNSSKPNNLQSLSEINLLSAEACEHLRSLPHLQELTCNCTYQPLLFDFDFLTELKSLTINLWFEGIPGKITTINFPLSITKLHLSGTLLPWEMISDIGRLPELQYLKLEWVAFIGTIWETSDDQFQNLRFLKLYHSNIEQWIASSEQLPRLCHLVLYGCNDLQNLPTELGDISTLHTIEVHECSYGASISGVRVEQEQRDLGNEDLQVIITHYRFSKEQLVFDYKEMEEKEPNSIDVGNKSGLPVHTHIACDYCEMVPIIGDRYKCKDCTDEGGYDLCGRCYTLNRFPGHYNEEHTAEHEFEIVIPNDEDEEQLNDEDEAYMQGLYGISNDEDEASTQV